MSSGVTESVVEQAALARLESLGWTVKRGPDIAPGGEIVLYQSSDGEVRLDARLDRGTVWLTQEHMSQLFGRERSVITKHVRSVFKEGELEQAAVCADFAHTAADGKTYQVDHYNLDMHGQDMPPDTLGAERRDYAQVILEQRLRDALLPKLISGELRVKDAERFTWGAA